MRKQVEQSADKDTIAMQSFSFPSNPKSNFFNIVPPTNVPKIALGTVMIPTKYKFKIVLFYVIIIS